MRKFLHLAYLGRNQIYLYLLGFLALVCGYFLGTLPLLLMLYRVMDQDDMIGESELESFYDNPDFTLFGISSNTGFLILLSMFAFAFLLFYFVFKPLHKRNFLTLITPFKSLNWKKIIFGFLLWLMLIIAAEGFLYLQDPSLYSFQFELKTFLFLLVICLLVLPLQTSIEELFFRGYMMQGIGSITPYPFIPLIITSVLFGLIHITNPEVGNFGLVTMMIYYILAGLFLGVITLLDDSLELALGVHFATNFFGAVFLGYHGAAIQTDSLFKVSEINASTMTIAFVICSIIFIIISKFVFKWKDFGYLWSNISGMRDKFHTEKKAINYNEIDIIDDF